MDFERFCDDLGLDRETALDMLRRFYDTSVEDMARIESGVMRGSLEDVADGAYSIKGAAKNLGIASIHRIAAELAMASRYSLDVAGTAAAALKSRLELLGMRLRDSSLKDLDI